jgi:hypothetical protein
LRTSTYRCRLSQELPFLSRDFEHVFKRMEIDTAWRPGKPDGLSPARKKPGGYRRQRRSILGKIAPFAPFYFAVYY